MFLALLSSGSKVSPAEAKAAPALHMSEDATDQCWVYTHLNKAGGSTVKKMLKNHWGPRYYTYSGGIWKMGNDYSQTIAEKLAHGEEWNVIAGGYVESLRRMSSVGSKCRWFTVFRHPITRMVSAYQYCRKTPWDQLCADHVLDARDVDLATFAKHWGNYAMRQFVLSFVSIDDVMKYAHADADDEAGKDPPGWYWVRMYLEDQTQDLNNEDIPETGMYAMLQPVQDLLRDHYSAVGILEEYNATLSLFNNALEMPGVDWHGLFASVGQVRVNDKHRDEKAALLAEAWTSAEIKKYMQLDLLLYEHVVDLFEQHA